MPTTAAQMENPLATSQGAPEPNKQLHQEGTDFSSAPRRICSLAEWISEHPGPTVAEIDSHRVDHEELDWRLFELEMLEEQGQLSDTEYEAELRAIERDLNLPYQLTTSQEFAAMLMPATDREAAYLKAAQAQQEPQPIDPVLDADAAVRRIELGLAPFDTAAGVDQFTDGGSFIFDQPETLPAVWGHGTEVLWAEGESLMIAGSMGLGKTTLAGQVIRARLGLGDGAVLGLPVAPTDGTVLYLAMDRPRQIARSLARQFKPAERATVTRQLAVWQGPPPADVAADPDTLLNLALRAGANTVVIDSVKDAAIGLSDDTVGAGYNRARQKLIAAGIQLLELHHLVKRNAQGGAPSTAADVYGSTWLANGTGSIIMLTGEPGDPVVGFRHVRQPAEEVGPFELLHDQTAGEITIHHQADLLDALRAAAADGLTASAAVAVTHPGEKLSGRAMAAAREKARRALDKYVRDGEATRLDGAKGGDPRLQQSATWFAA